MIIVNILGRLAEIYKPKSIDLTPVLELTDHNIQIRSAAFRALTNCEEDFEIFLIDRLRQKDKHEIANLINSLMYVGTKAALPELKKYRKSRSGMIQTFTHSAITLIMLREGYPEDEISKEAQVSLDFVLHHKARIGLLTRLKK